jgi:hypothetical protein
MAFTLYHADELPLVSVQSVTTKDLGQGVTEVTAVIENPKLVPTHSTADVQRKITSPDLVELKSTADLKVLLALKSSEPFFRQPQEQQRNQTEVKLATIGSYGVTYVRWLVEGQGPFEVSVTSVKGGRSSKRSD